MAAIGFVSLRQEALLRELLKHPGKLTIDDLAERLNVTRTAVRQHLMSLELDGLVSKAERPSTGGRPGQVYHLTDAGIALFPKRYSWFSVLLLGMLRAEKGSEGLATWLGTVADAALPLLRGRVMGKTQGERVAETAALLAELGYEAEVSPSKAPGEAEGLPAEPLIVARNCPYHDLARQYPEICAFDLRILEDLIQADISHEECMARGDARCVFRPIGSPAK